jgi:hypothetical protein
LLGDKKLVGVSCIHRNSWKPRGQLLYNWLPVAQPNEIEIIPCYKVAVKQAL